MPESPWRVLTDWTTAAGLDGSGLLALVVGGRAAEGIHLATLGYEVFVLYPAETEAEAAEQAAHVHHVAADVAALPEAWTDRFGLVVAFDTEPPWSVAAPQALVVAVADQPTPEAGGFTQIAVEPDADPDRPGARTRTILARL